MSTQNGRTSRKSFLSITPVDVSLTEGTNIPAPIERPQSRPRTPAELSRPPTPGGGPLTSHPSDTSGNVERMTSESSNRDTFKRPASPASAARDSTSPQPQRRPQGVRRIFSLSNIRSSFSSSRTSLSLPRQSSDMPPEQRAGVKRPPSPSMASTDVSSTTAPRPPLRQKKSGSWFRRKSGMFMTNGLEVVDENQRPETRESKRRKESSPVRSVESKRVKESSPAPLLPDIKSLGGGNLGGGDLGWDDKAFKRQ